MRLLVVVALLVVAPARAEDFTFDLPIDCRLGETCVVQNFVDRDPTAAWKDYRCGAMSYDGHKGTDFRIPSLAAMRAGVGVKAAAAGRVVHARDGMDDISVRDAQAGDIEARECGNGVLIDHNNGWTSQYCHMRKGSVAVRPGDRVATGQRLGLVGLSGQTEFPHLHFQIAFFGRITDPFSFDYTPDSCGDAGHRSLWRQKPQGAAAYPDAFILNSGFTEGTVTGPAIEEGGLTGRKPGPTSGQISAFVRLIGLRAGDILELSIVDPDDWSIASVRSPPMDRPKAQYALFAQAARPADGWTPGDYEARFTLRRDGRIFRQLQFPLRIGR